MERIEIIGNLGADAVIKTPQPNVSFIAFRVAVSKKFNGSDVTMWYDVTMNQTDSKILPFLKQGTKVFVRGYPSYRIFDSAKYHQKMIGVTISVNEIQLCGSKQDNPSPAQQKQEPADDLPFMDGVNGYNGQ